MKTVLVSCISLLIVSPWLIFSYLNTGNPVYPFFSSVYPATQEFTKSPLEILLDVFRVFFFAADPISPIYMLAVPILAIKFGSFKREIKILVIFSLLFLAFWAFTPQKNSRFLVPYLPLLSVISAYAFSYLTTVQWRVVLYFSLIVIGISGIYRLLANSKYIPYLIGLETKEEFLGDHLNFEFGDYIDVDRTVKEIVGEEKVIIYGIHNLYYVDFPFDHESWTNAQNYKFVLSRGRLPDENGLKLRHSEVATNTYLYERTR